MRILLSVLCLLNLATFYLLPNALSNTFCGQPPHYYVPHMDIHPLVNFGIVLNVNYGQIIVFSHIIFLLIAGFIKKKKILAAMTLICCFFFIIQLLMTYVVVFVL